MGYKLKKATYTYATLLDLISRHPEGTDIQNLKKQHGLHPEYDVTNTIYYEGIQKQKAKELPPHLVVKKINAAKAEYRISAAGKAHLNLKKTQLGIQTDLANVELVWKDTADDKAKSKQASFPQEIIPIQEPLVFSKALTKASETFEEIAIENQSAKTCLEEVHIILAQFLEANPTNRFEKLIDGLLQEVLEETDQFRTIIQAVFTMTEEIILDTAVEEEVAT